MIRKLGWQQCPQKGIGFGLRWDAGFQRQLRFGMCFQIGVFLFSKKRWIGVAGT